MPNWLGWAATRGKVIQPASVAGLGNFENSPKLVIDGKFVRNQTLWNAAGCVWWNGVSSQIVVDLGPFGIVPVMLLILVAGWRAVKAIPRFPVEAAFFSSLAVFAVVRSMAEQELLGLGNSFDLTFPIVLVSLWQAPYWCHREEETTTLTNGAGR